MKALKKSETSYKNCKLITYKNKGEGFTTYIFNGVALKAKKTISYKLKKDSIAFAKISIDSNENNFF